MAPKRGVKKAVAAKAAAKTALESRPSKIDQAQAAAEPHRPSRPLQRRSSDEVVERAINTHFRGMDRVALATRTVGGLTVNARVARDRQALKEKDPKSRLPTTYWRGLQTMYGGSDTPVSNLAVKRKEEPIADPLLSALQKITDVNPSSRSPTLLRSWLKFTTAVNQRELVGLLKTIVLDKRAPQHEVGPLVLDTMRCVNRLGLRDLYAEEVEACKDLVDHALGQLWARCKRRRVNLTTFVQSHYELINIALPDAPLRRVMQCDGKWATVMAELDELKECGHLGEELFGFTSSLVSAADFKKSLDAYINGIMQQGGLSKPELEHHVMELNNMAAGTGEGLQTEETVDQDHLPGD